MKRSVSVPGSGKSIFAFHGTLWNLVCHFPRPIFIKMSLANVPLITNKQGVC